MDKREKKFRELWKQAYIDYKDTMHFHHSKDDIDLANHDRCQFEDVAKKVFGCSQKRIDLNETRWDVEWKKKLL